ncbi:transposase [Streptomyces sp. NPDC055186]
MPRGGRSRSALREQLWGGRPSDLTDEQWAPAKPFLPAARIGPKGEQWEKHPRRRSMNALFSVVRTGHAWRQPPKNLPSRPTVYRHFARWSRGRSGQVSTTSPSTNSASAAISTGHGARSIPSASGPQGRSGPDGIRPTTADQELKATWSRIGTACPCHWASRPPTPTTTSASSPSCAVPTHPLPLRAAPSTTATVEGHDYDRLHEMAPQAPDPSPHHPRRHRALTAAGPPLVGRAHGAPTDRMPSTAPPLRAQGRALPHLRRNTL